jgi:hypothetical protein
MVRKVLYCDWTEAETALELLLDDEALLAELLEFEEARLPRRLMMGSVRL